MNRPAYFIPTVLVPLLLVTHALVFRLLLRRDTAAAPGGVARDLTADHFKSGHLV